MSSLPVREYYWHISASIIIAAGRYRQTAIWGRRSEAKTRPNLTQMYSVLRARCEAQYPGVAL
jgi:hypothetical protein